MDIVHPFPFDPAYGRTIDQLKRERCPTKAPADLEPFWRQAYDATLAVDPSPRWRPSAARIPKHDVLEVTFRTLGDIDVGAWLCMPSRGVVDRFVVMGHGYGGRAEPDPLALDGRTVVLFPCAPGFDLSADPARWPVNNAAEHVLVGIESPDRYLIRFCVAAHWSAATVMLDRFPEAAGSLVYRGVSFGGGLGALGAPWDPRIRGVELTVPTFGYHDFRLHHPCTGSGESVRQRWLKDPEIEHTLAYFDAAVTARLLHQPAVTICAAFDPAVPPPGQFAVANGIPEPVCRLVQRTGHFEQSYPEQEDEERERADAWEWLWRQVPRRQ